MLLVPANEFGWSADNYGATYSDANIGTGATSGGSNTKGAAVSCLSGATVAQDVYGISICFGGGYTTGAIRRWFVDLLIDPAGGTSWSVAIANLLAGSPSTSFLGYNYYFPLYLKAGTSIGIQAACSTGTQAIRACIRVFGKPSRPDLVKVGTKVETFGAVTGTTSGTSITPGSSSLGSYVSLGTTSNDLWWWQSGGIVFNDTTLTGNTYLIDVAAGDASNKKICVNHAVMITSSFEIQGKDAFGTVPPIRHIKGGETVYARAASCDVGPDTTPTTTAYGLGG